ncbi:hypothetical protein HPB49_015377 [Dermacentor silvarum]|uniref:Uncharacterized protein n=1 Tax=Dermacentor silvarum TaxID=543639 RepID=A0ACB8DJ44_DERSI|nr:hypothetical protein HPB49_015377 [Dermacentor silvarum]
MNDRLLEMGICNTASELFQAQYMNQVIRLARTKAGRTTLEALGINPPTQVASKRSLPPEWQQDIIPRPLPRNMHPVYHENTRAATAKAHDKYSDHASAFFVDAAGPLHNRSTATVVRRGQVVDCISATGIDIAAVEEAGIALAMRNPRATFVLTDSQAALRPIVKRVSGNSCCGYQGTREFEAMRLLMPPPENFYTGAPPTPPQHNFSLTRTILSPFFHILRSYNTYG